MLKSKPAIIAMAIIGAIIGVWAGSNAANSGFALILMVGILGLVAYLIFNGLRRNRKLEVVSAADRNRILGEQPAGARAIVYREGFVAKLSGFDIAIDGVDHAQLKSPQSVAIDLAPGDHALVVKMAGKAQPAFQFAVGSGDVAVIRIGMGMAGCEITRQDGPQSLLKLASIPMVRPDGPPAATGAAAPAWS
ncbi:hypothetical protein ACSBM8_09040 [Sphingomonas sp. ASY06-1R]|uniref:hypothetical protein n=1 Tax=Sphingomonas sp. ASY06-1R TaxID=3445771 RepID=UPI003FA31A8F